MVRRQSLSSALAAVRRNPIIVAVSVVFGFLQSPGWISPMVDSSLASLVTLGASAVSVLVAPFVMAGMISLSAEALDGRTSFDTFLQSGRENYVHVLAAYVLLLVVASIMTIPLFVVGTITVIYVGFSAVAVLTGGAPLTAGAAALFGVFGLLLLLTLIPVFFVQFFAHAIVLDGASVADSFTRSVSLVRRNVRTVLGYFLTLFGIGALVVLVSAVASVFQVATQLPGGFFGVPVLPSPVILAVQIVAAVVIWTISSVYWPFSVAVYRSISGN